MERISQLIDENMYYSTSTRRTTMPYNSLFSYIPASLGRYVANVSFIFPISKHALRSPGQLILICGNPVAGSFSVPAALVSQTSRLMEPLHDSLSSSVTKKS
jgi:hypothetical protein